MTASNASNSVSSPRYVVVLNPSVSGMRRMELNGAGGAWGEQALLKVQGVVGGPSVGYMVVRPWVICMGVC